jgi:hypothetical protein
MTKRPLGVYFDLSAGETLRRVLLENSSLFVPKDPTNASLIIFGSDEIEYIEKNDLYHTYKAKSVCITESDIPTFRLPGLYAANAASLLTSGRTRTINYFLSEQDRGNPEVRKLAGREVEKKYLYSFMGGSNSWARKRLFRALRSLDDTHIEPTDSYNHWSLASDDLQAKTLRMQTYAMVMAASKFSLCPRGCGLSSYRLFESMLLGVAPVIISDKWRPIEGIDWSFALFIPERHIPEIDRIVRQHAHEWEERGLAGQSVYYKLLAPDVVSSLLYEQLSHLAESYNPKREPVMTVTAKLRASSREVYWSFYGVMKRIALRTFHISGLSIPIRLNRSIEQQLNIGKITK